MKRRIVLIVSAVVLALLGTAVVYSYINGADSRALDGVKTTTVLVATKPIPAGIHWSEMSAGGYVAAQSVPASAAPLTALNSLKAGVDPTEVATFAVQPGQIVVREMFAQKVATTGALVIPGKLQALTIGLPPKANVGGYVASGSDVAVYFTVQVSSGQYSSKVLIARVNVLAVSQAPLSSTAAAGSTSPSAESLMVTLAVTQDQAERLVAAQKVGELYLALLTSTSESAEDGGTISSATK